VSWLSLFYRKVETICQLRHGRNSLKKHQQKCTDYSWKTLALQAKVSLTNLWGSTRGAEPSADSQSVDWEQEASQQKSVTVACFMSLEIKVRRTEELPATKPWLTDAKPALCPRGGPKKEYKVHGGDGGSCRAHRGIEEGIIFPRSNQIRIPTGKCHTECWVLWWKHIVKKGADTKLA